MIWFIGKLIIAAFVAILPAGAAMWIADKLFSNRHDPMGSSMLVLLIGLVAWVGSTWAMMVFA